MNRTLARRAPAVFLVTALLAALSVAGASTASATSNTTASTDGVHLLPDAWTGGCAVDFSLDPGSSSEYRANVLNGLTAIAAVTGMSFNQVGAGDDRADIRYTLTTSLPDGAAGLASNYGDVTLLATSILPSANNEQYDSNARDRIVTHETLHVLGLDHDDDAWSNSPDEVMNPTVSWQPLDFGAGDVAGMERLRGLNRCTAPRANAPAPVPTVDPTIAAQVQAESGASTPVAVSTAGSPTSDKPCPKPRRTDSTEGTCAPLPPTGTTASVSKPSKPSKPSKGEDSEPAKRPTPAPPVVVVAAPAAPIVVAPPKREEPQREEPQREQPKRPTPAPPVVVVAAPAAPIVVAPPKREELKREEPKREEPKREEPKRDESQRRDNNER